MMEWFCSAACSSARPQVPWQPEWSLLALLFYSFSDYLRPCGNKLCYGVCDWKTEHIPGSPVFQIKPWQWCCLNPSGKYYPSHRCCVTNNHHLTLLMSFVFHCSFFYSVLLEAEESKQKKQPTPDWFRGLCVCLSTAVYRAYSVNMITHAVTHVIFILWWSESIRGWEIHTLLAAL